MTKQILVVEDEPNILLALEFLMRQQGYSVRSVVDGDTAMAEIERSPPDLILLDLNIPGRSGFEVCDAVRENTAWIGTRILILTGKGHEEDRLRCLSLGADDYVAKPFATKDVIVKVREILGD